MTKFRNIRIAALELWAKKTGRQIMDAYGNYRVTDDFVAAYECRWQNQYQSAHVHLFCSLGSWASNLTDLFLDSRFDEMDLDDGEEGEILYRHYTRILLVVSEILTDFQDIYLKLLPKGTAKSVARSFYFPGTVNFNEIMNFINHVCKHKVGHIHYCNSHHPIYFEDSSMRRPRKYAYVQLGDDNHAGKTAVLVPSLEIIVRRIVHCYARLNNYFDKNSAGFKALCTAYS
jgi:hypothetical protein